MATLMELPTRLEGQITSAAEREGISPQEHATLLLRLANALVGGPTEPHPPLALIRRVAVPASERERLIPAIFQEMVKLYVHLRDVGSDVPFPSTPATPSTSMTDEVQATIRLWPDRPFEVSIDADWAMVVYVTPPVDRLVHAAGGQPRGQSILGKYAHIPYSSEDFIRDKQAEIELEERKWRR